MGNWLSIVVAIYLIAMVLRGYRKGLIRLAVSMVALVVTLVVVHISMPGVTEFLKEHTPIHQALQDGIVKNSGLEKDPPPNSEDLPIIQKTFIENLNLPPQLKEILIKNNNSEIYHMLGVDAFTDYVGNYLADIILNVIGFVLMFVIVYLIIQILMRWLDIIARLPIISGVNKLTGALLGGMQGLVFLWIICLLLTAFAGTSWGIAVMNQIDESSWLSFIYDNNILNYIILGVIKGIW